MTHDDTHTAASMRYNAWRAQEAAQAEKARQKALQDARRAFASSPEGQIAARRARRERIKRAVLAHPMLGRWCWAAIAADVGCTKSQARWYGRARRDTNGD